MKKISRLNIVRLRNKKKHNLREIWEKVDLTKCIIAGGAMSHAISEE